MRTLFEIVEAAKANQPTTHEECLYALLAYSGLSYFDSSSLQHLAFEPSRFRTPEREAEESHRRWKMALNKSPKDWLGWNNDPKNPDCQRFHEVALKLFDKFTESAPKESKSE